ncbi:oxidoreductase [Caballeronia terrestris]|uniref:Oxidoreductase n=1 Tax=Caballeronia terrestris TaxID=1226301 RepID=A0A158FMD2_9BURK|nr:DUF934 domain-containing protein [Caballeronia terrestris]SAL21018.1 oxidoreductase [Caballeronia terrestris]
MTTTSPRLKILMASENIATLDENVITLPNDADPLTLRDQLQGITRIDLHFPQFTDGRAYSQAYLLRRRLRFTGDLRATGDVLIDQLLQMERMGFSSAVLKDGLDIADAESQFARFPGFYQTGLSIG